MRADHIHICLVVCVQADEEIHGIIRTIISAECEAYRVQQCVRNPNRITVLSRAHIYSHIFWEPWAASNQIWFVSIKSKRVCVFCGAYRCAYVRFHQFSEKSRIGLDDLTACIAKEFGYCIYAHIGIYVSDVTICSIQCLSWIKMCNSMLLAYSVCVYSI